MEDGVWVAHSREASVVARLLDDFNREYDTPSPGVPVLTERLEQLLAGDQVSAVLVGDPACGVGLLTLRPNVWYAGPVGLLDELYIAPSQRGQGLGTALLHAAEEVVRGRGGEVLEINVDGDDVEAVASMSGTGTGTPSRVRTNSSSTTSVSSSGALAFGAASASSEMGECMARSGLDALQSPPGSPPTLQDSPATDRIRHAHRRVVAATTT